MFDRKEYMEEYNKQYSLRNPRYMKKYYQENKEHRKIYNKKWRIEHKEYFKEYAKKYRQKNKEKISKCHKKYAKQYYQNNKEHYKQYYKNNREKLLEQNRKWLKDNPEYMKKWYRTEKGKAANQRKQSKRQAREKDIINTLTAEEWINILKKYEFMCAYCGKKFTLFDRETRDHVIPISKGGDNIKENVVPACKSCNSKKHNKIIEL